MFIRRHWWAVLYSILLIGFTIYLAMDTFVISRVYSIPNLKGFLFFLRVFTIFKYIALLRFIENFFIALIEQFTLFLHENGFNQCIIFTYRIIFIHGDVFLLHHAGSFTQSNLDICGCSLFKGWTVYNMYYIRSNNYSMLLLNKEKPHNLVRLFFV